MDQLGYEGSARISGFSYDIMDQVGYQGSARISALARISRLS